MPYHRPHLFPYTTLFRSGFTEHDHMIEALASNRSNHSLYIGSLPRRARCRQNLADAHVSHLFSEVIPEDSIAVALAASLCRARDRKSTRLNSSHANISYAVPQTSPLSLHDALPIWFHGTRSHDRGTRVESIQSLALHRLAAKASAVQTEPRGCPCLAPVLGSHPRR